MYIDFSTSWTVLDFMEIKLMMMMVMVMMKKKKKKKNHAAAKYYVRREALVWNTRLRMDKGVGVAGNGMDLLNNQTTKQSTQQGVMSQKFLGSQ
jgi:hypothetical protein